MKFARTKVTRELVKLGLKTFEAENREQCVFQLVPLDVFVERSVSDSLFLADAFSLKEIDVETLLPLITIYQFKGVILIQTMRTSPFGPLFQEL
ncbi:hypothetical protein [Parasedimentitalea marina]|nr:hypothetical protein [Parasedimentitalea marina]